MRSKKFSKEQIIKAAANVISEEGLENASVNDIAREAGIAKGSIYNYFKSRDEILIEGVRYFANQRTELLKKLLKKHPTASKKLITLLRANKKMAEDQPEIFFMNYASLISTHKNIKTRAASEFFKAYIDLFDDVIREGIRNGEFQKINPRLVALSLVVTQDMANILEDIDPGIVSTEKIEGKLLKLIRR